MASWVSTAVSAIAGHAGSAVYSIVSCTASSVVEKIVDMGFSFISKPTVPMESETALKRVQNALPQIRAIMSVAEALKMKDPSCSEWFEQSWLAVNAAEDVLDELEYNKLVDMVKSRDEGSGSASSSKKYKTCAMSDDILGRLKKAVRMLDEAAAGVDRLLQLADKLGIRYLSESQIELGADLRRETTSFLVEREVFGRDVEKGLIIDWLSRPTQVQLSSLGIIGVGGLGKTTLAQFAYQEMHVKDYFEKTIWVCVSTNFSVESITTKILAELGENSCGDYPLNVLQESLKGKIHSKKFLLILDDVWEDKKRRDWEQLIAPFRFAQQGSKILFTTRMKSVANLLADVINTEHCSLALQDLAEQELRSLFNSYAFHGFNPNNHGDLLAIGDQIIKILRGSPLAAKVIGSLLNSRMDLLYWRRILSHGSLINSEQGKDIINVLKLSYYNLPTDLKVCFRFCSIFPRDYLFNKKKLIEMWMTSGFIRQHSCQEERLEDIGEDYFNHLLRKSIFEPWGKKRYVMHDLIHEMAQIVSNRECFRVVPNDKSIAIPGSVRHVSVHETEIQKVSHLENIRSLVITTKKQTSTDLNVFVLPNNLIKKNLRLLKIYGHYSCKLPDEICCLVHLRYLSIELTNVHQSFKYLLPASIYKLYHLQVLEFTGASHESSYLGIANAGISNLVRLRYMRLPYQIMQTICRIHTLTSLQELTFVIGKESGYRINELGTLNNLRRLAIYNTENINDPVEARSANLLGKESLRSLSLIWTSESKPYNPEQIIDNLQPHPNLIKLEIKNYKGQSSPIWMRDMPLLNLQSLTLSRCLYLNKQPVFGKMPYLKILDIYECPNLYKLPDLPLSLTEFRVRNVGLTSLPYLYQSSGINTLAPSCTKSSLTSVKIIKCPNLIPLNGFLQQDALHLQCLEELTIQSCEKLAQLPMHVFKTFASLRRLCIGDCPNLTRLPCLPLSLVTFEISEITLTTLPRYFQSVGLSDGPSTTSLRTVSIRICPNLTALNGFLQQDNINFQAINTIRIEECNNLVHIPVGAFSKFVSLANLIIENCPKLVAVDNHKNFLPPKLKRIFMRNCGKLDVPLLESSSMLTTLTELVIKDCSNIARIPSSENVFGSLRKLYIRGCGKLAKHSSMQQPLNVNQGKNFASLKINDLSIGHLSLLFIEPLRSLISVCDLSVDDCLGMEALPEQWLLQNRNTLRELIIRNASTLQSLPATMARLIVLETLLIFHADLLLKLPELPASLKVRKICSSDGANKF